MGFCAESQGLFQPQGFRKGECRGLESFKEVVKHRKGLEGRLECKEGRGGRALPGERSEE